MTAISPKFEVTISGIDGRQRTLTVWAASSLAAQYKAARQSEEGDVVVAVGWPASSIDQGEGVLQNAIP
jgi:hypothetical protein